MPPSANEIVFASNFQQDLFDLYSIKSDGSNRQRLTNTPEVSEAQPSWRPDRRVVAFDAVAKNSRDWNIFTRNADGSGLKQLTHSPALDAQPAFSPDGRRIAFTSNRDGQAEIYLMNADGSGLQRLTNDVDNDDIDPAWSPDGRQIAFAKGPTSPGRTAFVSSPPTRFAAQRRTAFSHGGAVRTDRYDLCIMDANGANVRRLIIDDAANRSPSWSRNGTTILFFHTDPNGGRFETISPNGDNRNILVQYGGEKPKFSLDASEVIVSGLELYKFKVSDKQINYLTNDRVTDAAAVATDPDWK